MMVQYLKRIPQKSSMFDFQNQPIITSTENTYTQITLKNLDIDDY